MESSIFIKVSHIIRIECQRTQMHSSATWGEIQKCFNSSQSAEAKIQRIRQGQDTRRRKIYEHSLQVDKMIWQKGMGRHEVLYTQTMSHRCNTVLTWSPWHYLLVYRLPYSNLWCGDLTITILDLKDAIFDFCHIINVVTVVVNCQSRGSHTIKHILCYRLFYSKTDHNFQSEHHAVLVKTWN